MKVDIGWVTSWTHLFCLYSDVWFLQNNNSIAGGLAEEVDEKVLQAAFIPFGDIVYIQIPLDYETGKKLICFILQTQYCDAFKYGFWFSPTVWHIGKCLLL